MNTIKLLTFFALMILTVIPVQAKLLISPLYITLTERDRSAKLIVSNISDRTLTYRMGWQQMVQDPLRNGFYTEIDTKKNQDEETRYLQDFAVFSPRQVTLKPGEKQTIRIGIRRPPELPEGEYKSHFNLRVVDNANEFKPEKRIAAFINMAYSLPVVYRVGAYDAQINIGEPQIVTNKDGKLVMSLPVKRSGMHGILGRIEVFHTPKDGERTLLADYSNVNIFPEISQKIFEVPFGTSGLEPGELEIIFYRAEKSNNEKQVMDSKIIEIGN